MIPQIDRLQIILDKILLDRYQQIKHIQVFEDSNSTISVQVFLIEGFEDSIRDIENEIRKISKMISIPIEDVLFRTTYI
jgi:hypothetical protein